MQDVAVSLADGPYHSGSAQALYQSNHQVRTTFILLHTRMSGSGKVMGKKASSQAKKTIHPSYFRFKFSRTIFLVCLSFVCR